MLGFKAVGATLLPIASLRALLGNLLPLRALLLDRLMRLLPGHLLIIVLLLGILLVATFALLLLTALLRIRVLLLLLIVLLGIGSFLLLLSALLWRGFLVSLRGTLLRSLFLLLLTSLLRRLRLSFRLSLFVALLILLPVP